MKLLSICLAACLMLPALCGYGQIQFTQTAGPGTNPVWSFAKGNGGTLLVATATKVYRSSDHGTTWKPSSNDFVIINRGSLSFDTARTKVYLIDESGLYSSSDNGANWTAVSSLSGAGNVYGVTVSMANTILVGSYSTGVWTSNDEGASWKSQTNGLPREPGINDLYPVLQLIASPSGSVFAITQAGMARSTDEGKTWAALSGLPTTISSCTFSTDAAMFVAAIDGLYVSHDDGSTWTNISANTGLNITSATSVATDDDAKGVLVSNGSGLWASLDDGTTWKHVRTYTADGNNSLCITGSAEFFFDGMQNNGLFRSTNQASAWSPSSTGIITSNIQSMASDSSGRIFAVDGASGLYSSEDFGDTWTKLQEVELSPRGRAAVCAAPNGDIYETIYGTGMLRSTNAGSNWTDITTNLPGTNRTFMLTICSAPNGSVFAGGFNGTVYRTSNGGSTWSIKRSGIPTDTITIMQSSTAGTVFAICSSGVYSTLDNGETWTAGINSPTNVTAFSTVATAAFATNALGLFASTDAGATWLPIPASILGATGVIAAKSGGYYVSTLTSLQYSTDGLNWTTLPYPFATAATAMIQDGKYGVIYAATAGSGVYRGPAPVHNGGVETGHSVVATTSASNYPNPFGAKTMLRYTLTEEGMVELTISDLSGKQIQKLVASRQDAGMHEVTFDATSLHLASGVYLCTLNVGGHSATTPIVYTKQ